MLLCNQWSVRASYFLIHAEVTSAGDTGTEPGNRPGWEWGGKNAELENIYVCRNNTFCMLICYYKIW